MSKKICLLRGINVGGKNIIKMVELRACLESLGLTEVNTYIQSGNIVFSSPEPISKLNSNIEKALKKQFGYSEPILILTSSKLKSILETMPRGFGQKPDEYNYDFIFMTKEITSNDFSKVLTLTKGVDEMFIGNGVIYFSRLKSKAAQSNLTKITSKPEYKKVTIRNWNTTNKLLEMLN